MKSHKIFLILPLLTFLISLFFTAFSVVDMGKTIDYKSGELLFFGSISFLGGGILEFFIWTANVWLLLAILFLYKKEYVIAILLSLLALIISLSFVFWNEILVSENGRMGEIYGLKTGYFLWVLSIFFMMGSSIYLRIKFRHN
ncbi:hypothetical protein [Chryseobacterium paridis]|uniref:Uncharacterized protein n=1 Tax=Chryseobacterium paridis TaxID=2800328 RepID=A0ABS1FYR8_9FLAO|nr:hypothetical protein [Chryseobacterium paridis]MBK1897593.1 hypothetical protein [Chryseobacterium paridis]